MTPVKLIHQHRVSAYIRISQENCRIHVPNVTHDLGKQVDVMNKVAEETHKLWESMSSSRLR